MDPLQHSVSDVLRATGHQSPEIGGGAASILAGLVGLSLVRMAVATTGERTEADMAVYLTQLDKLSAGLEDLARADVEIFRHYVAALRLPREMPGQETRRDAALRDSGHQAAETPLRAAYLIADGLDVAAQVAPVTHSEVTSDVYAGAAILNGAFFGAIATLDINLKPQRMAEEREELLKRRQAVLVRRKAAMAGIERQANTDSYLLT